MAWWLGVVCCMALSLSVATACSTTVLKDTIITDGTLIRKLSVSNYTTPAVTTSKLEGAWAGVRQQPIPSGCQTPAPKPPKRSAPDGAPLVLLIVGDDIGWNDVGWHGNADVETPNLDKLAQEGVILDQFYAGPQCSPSRAALLSGRYPYHVSMQHHVLARDLPHLPHGLLTLADHMTAHGYSSHAAGKWHEGQESFASTPTFRGYESYFGFLSGAEDYFKHQLLNASASAASFTVNGTGDGKYSADLFTDSLIHTVQSHDGSTPLFLTAFYQNSHTPIEAPPSIPTFTSRYPRAAAAVADFDAATSRDKLRAMTSYMDYSVGRLLGACKPYADNMVVVFVSDNGGPCESGADNAPLRGGKHTLWQGGVRNVAFVYDSRQTAQSAAGSQYTGLMHQVDWVPTLVTGLLGRPLDRDPYPLPVDGVNQWDAIFGRAPPPRHQVLLNFDLTTTDTWYGGYVGVINDTMKLLLGNPGTPNDWCGVKDGAGDPVGSGKSGLFCARQDGPFPCPGANCAHTAGPYWPAHQLYNISADPTERHDLSADMPEVVQELKDVLMAYNQTMTCATAYCQAANGGMCPPSSSTPTNLPWVPLNATSCMTLHDCTQDAPFGSV